MLELDASATIGEFVAQRPSRARVFERLGIDYCCGGKRALADVCVDKELNVETVLHTIRESDAASATDDMTVYLNMPLTRLADHIEEAHHAWLREELPRIAMMFAKVVRAHGQKHPEMVGCHDVFMGFRAELETHMNAEEQLHFPMIRTLEAGGPADSAKSLSESIRQLEHEHDSAGRALDRMREATNSYTPPATACNTFRVLLASLAELERNMHEHVHKENNILFPRAMKLEAAAAVLSEALTTG